SPRTRAAAGTATSSAAAGPPGPSAAGPAGHPPEHQGPRPPAGPGKPRMGLPPIDWAAEIHAVCVPNPAGQQVAAFPVAHTADGLARMIAAPARLGDPACIPIAIERPNGRLVDVLLEAGHPVVPAKPNAIKTWRDCEVLSGAKSDPGDAAVIAEYLRLRQHRLRVAAPYSGQTTALRTVTRTCGDLVDTRVATANQLTALLEAHWPGAAVIFADIDSPIA